MIKFNKYIPRRKFDVTGGLGTMVGAGISTAGSVTSSIYAADKQYEATKETNEMNKQLAAEKNALDYQVFTEGNEFNRIEAEKARDFNEKMQLRQEQYNSLGNQVKQAQAANINPAAVAGGLQTTVGSQSGAQAVSEPVPSFAAAHMQTPDLSALQGISQAFGNFANSQLALAQAGKAKAETESQWSLNKWIDKEKQAGIYKTRSDAARNFAEVKHLQQQVNVGKETVKQLQASTALLTEQAFSQSIENAFKGNNMKLQYDLLQQEFHIKEQQAKRLVATFAYDVAASAMMPQKIKSEIDLSYSTVGLNKEQADSVKALAALYKTQNDNAAFDLGVKQDFKEIEKVAGLLGPVLKYLLMYMSNK